MNDQGTAPVHVAGLVVPADAPADEAGILSGNISMNAPSSTSSDVSACPSTGDFPSIDIFSNDASNFDEFSKLFTDISPPHSGDVSSFNTFDFHIPERVQSLMDAFYKTEDEVI